MSKIYTRKGDEGETSLQGNKRLSKAERQIEVLGQLDELNSAIGLAVALLPAAPEVELCRQHLLDVQNTLLDLGAILSTTSRDSVFPERHTATLELWMDELDQQLPPLHAFVLPGGHPAAAALHLARSICRRAERHLVCFKEHSAVPSTALSYLNRLSDFLFVAGRSVNQALVKAYPKHL